MITPPRIDYFDKSQVRACGNSKGGSSVSVLERLVFDLMVGDSIREGSEGEEDCVFHR